MINAKSVRPEKLCPDCGQQLTKNHSDPDVRWLCPACDRERIQWAEEERQKIDWINANYDWEAGEWSPLYRNPSIE